MVCFAPSRLRGLEYHDVGRLFSLTLSSLGIAAGGGSPVIQPPWLLMSPVRCHGHHGFSTSIWSPFPFIMTYHFGVPNFVSPFDIPFSSFGLPFFVIISFSHFLLYTVYNLTSYNFKAGIPLKSGFLALYNSLWHGFGKPPCVAVTVLVTIMNWGGSCSLLT